MSGAADELIDPDLHLARAYYVILRESSPDIVNVPRLLSQIQSSLDSAQAGYERLDITGKRSADEITGELEGYRRSYHLRIAREIYNTIMGNVLLSSSHSENELDKALKEAGAGYDALDPEGKESASDIKRKITGRLRAKRLIAAKSELNKLLFPMDTIEHPFVTLGTVYDLLAENGQGYQDIPMKAGFLLEVHKALSRLAPPLWDKASNFSKTPAIRLYKDFIDQLPELPSAGKGFADALFTPDPGTGYAPVDNPLLWEDEAAVRHIFSRLDFQQNPLSRVSERKGSIFGQALRAMPAKQLVSLVNGYGLSIGEGLLGQDGQPSSLLKEFMYNPGGLAALFIPSNLTGDNRRVMRTVYYTLPQEYRPRQVRSSDLFLPSLQGGHDGRGR